MISSGHQRLLWEDLQSLVLLGSSLDPGACGLDVCIASLRC